MTREHGGADAQGVPRWDFSTNANACGPCPRVAAALRDVDIRHYPDPGYRALRGALAAFHGVAPWRVVVAASASEFIMRITACLARAGARRAWIPASAYGEYAHAARIWGLARVDDPVQADLCWLCEPSSPLGTAEPQWDAVVRHDAVVVLDRAYEPLRLSGASALRGEDADRVWQLWSPNKALGMTGVRGAYAIAPADAAALADSLEQQAPSWSLGAHAVAMLQAWTQARTQQWLAQSRDTLRQWKALQQNLLNVWPCLPSDANFFCMQAELDADFLRLRGIKLREATSFGLPGMWRLSVQPPAAQAALRDALEAGGVSREPGRPKRAIPLGGTARSAKGAS
ncbi:aminotransferase class I/II-fold pyridoxal phosphate-dependent enzyme [Bordetella sp. FB-8]|uniref:aminotransferase class I/II-fold pyridoxal phosphate-dependent enzyme n=1 Tax=Bordetella sp. FB-8 TaxID=1159870 RepID=UPI00037D6478|nr:aminotransferase class I/II-fold pyridoxal phosphate-dependent enzyme [Bordetella sp. FB-8]